LTKNVCQKFTGHSIAEKPTFEEMSWQEYIEDKRVLRAAFHLTHRCNLNCHHCGPDSRSDSKIADPSLKDIDVVIQALADYGVRRLDLTGGEVFLRRDILPIIDIATRSPISCAVITNGTLLTPSLADLLAKRAIHSVKTSLDGLERNHDAVRGLGNYNRTEAAIRLLVERDMRVKVLFTLYRNNAKDLPELALRLSGLGVWRMAVRPCMKVGRAARSIVPTEVDWWVAYRHLLSVSKGLKCGFIEWSWANPFPSMNIWANNPYGLVEESGRHVTILPDGAVLMDFCKGLHPDNVFGNAFRDDMRDVLKLVEAKAQSFICDRSHS
jgi:MoaA/NifB/PqqE/SkfB family radical SAM enzyme